MTPSLGLIVRVMSIICWVFTECSYVFISFINHKHLCLVDRTSTWWLRGCMHVHDQDQVRSICKSNHTFSVFCVESTATFTALLLIFKTYKTSLRVIIQITWGLCKGPSRKCLNKVVACEWSFHIYCIIAGCLKK